MKESVWERMRDVQRERNTWSRTINKPVVRGHEGKRWTDVCFSVGVYYGLLFLKKNNLICGEKMLIQSITKRNLQNFHEMENCFSSVRQMKHASTMCVCNSCTLRKCWYFWGSRHISKAPCMHLIQNPTRPVSTFPSLCSLFCVTFPHHPAQLFPTLETTASFGALLPASARHTSSPLLPEDLLPS